MKEGKTLTLKTLTISLFILSGICLLAAPAARKGKPASPPTSQIRRWEEEAWGSSLKGKKASQNKKPAQPSKKNQETPTVHLKPVSSPKPPKNSNPSSSLKPKADLGNKGTVNDPLPGLPPNDFSSEEEVKARLEELNQVDQDILRQINRITGQKTDEKALKEISGLRGARITEAKMAQILANPQLKEVDRETLLNLRQQRDTALYLLGAAYMFQEKHSQAQEILRFILETQKENTPLYRAASNQLNQLERMP